MKMIWLTQGQFTLVDDEDYEYLSKFTWHIIKRKHTYYVTRHTPMVNKKRTKIIMHREILKCKNSEVGDHIDGNGLNNQRSNLRVATYSQNLQNQKARNGLSSQFKGVYFNKGQNKWKSHIGFNGKQIFLGYFDSEIEAAKSYDAKAKELYNEFSKPNFIE